MYSIYRLMLQVVKNGSFVWNMELWSFQKEKYTSKMTGFFLPVMTWRNCSVCLKKESSPVKHWVARLHQHKFFNPFLLPYQASATSVAKVLPSHPSHPTALWHCLTSHTLQTERWTLTLVTFWMAWISPQLHKIIFSAGLRLATPRQWAHRGGLSSQPHCKQPQDTGAFLPPPHILWRAD